MYTCPIQLSDVRYNAATQCFEASVTVHDNSTIRTYACAIQAPMSLTFEEAANSLTKQAITQHQHRGGLFSEVVRYRPKQRTGFDPARWLDNLINLPEQRAA